MRKPDNWMVLPANLLESILWEVDLDYDPYESSMAEKVHDIICENVSDTNQRMIDAYWENLTEERFESFVRNQLEADKRSVAYLEELLAS